MKNHRQHLYQQVMSSSNHREVYVDSSLVESLFNNDQSLSKFRYTQTIDEEVDDDKSFLVELIREIIDHNLPPIERSIINKIYFDGMRQEGIARLFNITQEMVSYHKQRAEMRIRYFLKARMVGISHMRDDLQDVVTPKQLEALLMYFEIHNQSKIAQICNVTQSAICTRLKLGLSQLRLKANTNPELQKYYDVFRDLFIYNSLQSSQTKKDSIYVRV